MVQVLRPLNPCGRPRREAPGCCLIQQLAIMATWQMYQQMEGVCLYVRVCLSVACLSLTH